MEDLRAQIPIDAQDMLESEFRCALELIDPNGNEYTGLFGRVLYDSVSVSSDGIASVVRNPNVTIAIASLSVIPEQGEKWIARINLSNDLEGTLVPYLAERPNDDSRSLGHIRLNLTRLEQS